ncbi:Uncharacterized protein Rs2_17514 [Raphanus sativus]|nr:Uncharacterized protein Rs2_17514 [Raphanus sativus]
MMSKDTLGDVIKDIDSYANSVDKSGGHKPPAVPIVINQGKERCSNAKGGVVVEEEVAAPVQEKPPSAVYSTTMKFKKLISKIDADTLVDFSNGLVLKGNELLSIPSIIHRLIRMCVMDSCVSVIRESLFKNINPANDPRADMLPCRFYGAFAAEYSKFKKCRRQEGFTFNLDLVNSVTVRCDELGNEWLKDIDYLYSPFNIDKNRWVGLVVDLRLHTLTVFLLHCFCSSCLKAKAPA